MSCTSAVGVFTLAMLSVLLCVATGGCSLLGQSQPANAPISPTASPTSMLPVSPSPVPTKAVSPTANPAPVRIDLVIGDPYLDQRPAEYKSRFQAWAGQLSQATGLSFTLSVQASADELDLLEQMRDGKVALAHLTAWAYVYGHERGWVEPGPMDLTWDAQVGQAFMLIARVDSGLQPGESSQFWQQLQGKRPCYQPSYPRIPTLPVFAEYILPAGLLALQGVHTAAPVFVDPSRESPAAAVFRQACDFAAWSPVMSADAFRNMLPFGLSGISLERWAKEMQILWTSPPVQPTGLFAFSARVPLAQRQRISEAIAAAGYPWPSPWKDIEQKMAPFDDALYAQFARMIAASGVNVVTYMRPTVTVQATPTPGWSAAPTGTLVLDADIRGDSLLLPLSGSASVEHQLVLPAIYAELARMDAMGTYIPYLARDLPTSGNGLLRFVGSGENQQLEVEFPLRSGLTWQDGQPLTADDLVFSWQLVMDPNWPDAHYGHAGWAAEVYVADVVAAAPDRVVYRFMSQRQARAAAQSGGRLGDPRYYTELAEQSGPVVPLDILEVGRNVLPRHLLAGQSARQIAFGDFAQHPIYAGAYKLVSAGEAGAPIVLEAFSNFALGEPQIERVVIGSQAAGGKGSQTWLDPGSLLEALQAGAVHAQVGRPVLNIRAGENLAGYEAIAGHSASVTWVNTGLWEVLDFNLDNSHLADLRVRQAIAHALDRQAIINAAVHGHGSLMRSYLPSWHPLYAGDAVLPDYGYDPDLARALLNEAGYDLSQTPAVHPNRGPLILRLATFEYAPYLRKSIVDLIQQELAVVGIKVEAKTYAAPDFEGKDCQATRNGRHFDLGLAGYLPITRYPVGWVEQVTLTDSIPSPENSCASGKSNWPGWRNSLADALVSQMRDGRLALEEPRQYQQAWAEHQRLWATELPSLPLFNAQRPLASSPGLTGLQPSPFASGQVGDTWNIFSWVLK